MWCNQMGTVWNLTLFERLYLLNWWSNLNSENSYSSVFVSSKSYYLLKICLNVWFKRCRLMKSARFRTVPIWLHHSVHTGEFKQPWRSNPLSCIQNTYHEWNTEWPYIHGRVVLVLCKTWLVTGVRQKIQIILEIGNVLLNPDYRSRY